MEPENNIQDTGPAKSLDAENSVPSDQEPLQVTTDEQPREVLGQIDPEEDPDAEPISAFSFSSDESSNYETRQDSDLPLLQRQKDTWQTTDVGAYAADLDEYPRTSPGDTSGSEAMERSGETDDSDVKELEFSPRTAQRIENEEARGYPYSERPACPMQWYDADQESIGLMQPYPNEPGYHAKVDARTPRSRGGQRMGHPELPPVAPVLHHRPRTPSPLRSENAFTASNTPVSGPALSFDELKEITFEGFSWADEEGDDQFRMTLSPTQISCDQDNQDDGDENSEEEHSTNIANAEAEIVEGGEEERPQSDMQAPTSPPQAQGEILAPTGEFPSSLDSTEVLETVTSVKSGHGIADFDQYEASKNLSKRRSLSAWINEIEARDRERQGLPPHRAFQIPEDADERTELSRILAHWYREQLGLAMKDCERTENDLQTVKQDLQCTTENQETLRQRYNELHDHYEALQRKITDLEESLGEKEAVVESLGGKWKEEQDKNDKLKGKVKNAKHLIAHWKGVAVEREHELDELSDSLSKSEGSPEGEKRCEALRSELVALEQLYKEQEEINLQNVRQSLEEVDAQLLKGPLRHVEAGTQTETRPNREDVLQKNRDTQLQQAQADLQKLYEQNEQLQQQLHNYETTLAEYQEAADEVANEKNEEMERLKALLFKAVDSVASAGKPRNQSPTSSTGDGDTGLGITLPTNPNYLLPDITIPPRAQSASPPSPSGARSRLESERAASQQRALSRREARTAKLRNRLVYQHTLERFQKQRELERKREDDHTKLIEAAFQRLSGRPMIYLSKEERLVTYRRCAGSAT